MYQKGQGVAQDLSQAVKWYQKAAEQNDPGAQTSLGLMYDLGKGVEQDSNKALEWFKKAAEQGDVGAQYRLEELNKKESTIVNWIKSKFNID